MNGYPAQGMVDFVDDPVIPNPDPIMVVRTGQFNGMWRERLVRKLKDFPVIFSTVKEGILWRSFSTEGF